MGKQCIASAARPAAAQARMPIREKDLPQPILTSLGRVLPDAQEIALHVRARSAVLRVAQRTAPSLPADSGASFVSAVGIGSRRTARFRSTGKKWAASAFCLTVS